MAKLVSRLPKIAGAITEASKAALLQTAADVFAISQDLVPVDTGALKSTGGAIPISSSKVVVGYGNDDDVKYAGFVEFGTSKSAAQPFLLPALVQAQEIMEIRIKENIEKGLGG